jgi:CheY-like chemotaxis protein
MHSLQDMRVLVVENDELNATLLQLQLESEGLKVVGIAGTVASALSMVEALNPQLVFLDYWLAANENSSPVATVLTELGIPYLVVTGMEPSQLPGVFKAGVMLAKPYTGRDLAKALSRAVALA